MALGLSLFSCTQQVASEFQLSQQQQNLALSQNVNTKVDMLWVVDNSTSMEVVQAKVRAGIQQFAQTYMKPTWDIHAAAITTDTYLAHPSFWQGPSGQNSYLTTTIAGSSNYAMDYLNQASHVYSGVTVPGRSAHYFGGASSVTAAQFSLFNSFQPSAYSPPVVTHMNGGTEEIANGGLRFADAIPVYGPNWAKLLIGNHDGPQPAMCWDSDPSNGAQFMTQSTACYHRDDPADPQYHIGVNNCLSPASGESGASQCVNTFANNTVHSGKPIISTLPPSGTPGDQTWINGLIADFQVNLTPSSAGNGSERAFQSVLQFMNDNENNSGTQLFRAGSVRVIVFVGDEDDQSQFTDSNQFSYGIGTALGTGTPGSYVAGQGTKAHYVPENASAPYVCKKAYPLPLNQTVYPTGDAGCVDPAWLIPVATVKQDFDNFFHQLDGTTSSQNPNYFVTAITTMNTAGLVAANLHYVSQRYPALVDLVGNGSMTLDLTDSDYTPLLNQVGQTIEQAVGSFQLSRAPVSQETTIVSILHADGTVTIVNSAQYTINGTTLLITDLSLIATFTSSDQLSVNYQPLTST